MGNFSSHDDRPDVPSVPDFPIRSVFKIRTNTDSDQKRWDI